MTKIYEIVGNDYYASSNDHVILPEGIDIKTEFLKYKESHWRDRGNFADFLITRGAFTPTDNQLETFDEQEN